jgi:hypothetical protein
LFLEKKMENILREEYSSNGKKGKKKSNITS